MIGRRIKVARAMSAMKLKDLAARVGVTPTSIYNWERGTYEPSTSDLIALSDALGVSVEYLVRGGSPAAGNGNGTPSPEPVAAVEAK